MKVTPPFFLRIFKFCLTAGLLLFMQSCSHQEDDGSVSGDGFVKVTGCTVSGTVSGSDVFIAGRTVIIPSLLVCDHEVTQKEYYAVMGTNPSSDSSSVASVESQKNHPVEILSWYDCLVYCNKRSLAEGLTPCYTISDKTNPSDWGTVPIINNSTWNVATCNFNANGYRLPTEAEWEYLARGGNISNRGQSIYSGSNMIDDVAWYNENSGFKTHEVKKKKANSLGLYDMCGNAWEWCWDWGGTITSTTPSTGVASGSKRVLRGGSWYRNADTCTIQHRETVYPYTRNASPGVGGNNFGLRLVRSEQVLRCKQDYVALLSYVEITWGTIYVTSGSSFGYMSSTHLCTIYCNGTKIITLKPDIG